MKGFLQPAYALCFLFISTPTLALEETTRTTTVVLPADSNTTIVTPTPTPTPGTSTTIVSETPSGTRTTRIVTPAPEPKEVIVEPTGFVNCTSVAGAWVNNIWVPDHKVCYYENSPQGKMWVSGYWGCDDYDLASGACTHWSWSTARWQ